VLDVGQRRDALLFLLSCVAAFACSESHVAQPTTATPNRLASRSAGPAGAEKSARRPGSARSDQPAHPKGRASAGESAGERENPIAETPAPAEPARDDTPKSQPASRKGAASRVPHADAVELSRFLEKPAAASMRKREYTRAIALYRGLVSARGEGDRIALDLARAWTLAGRYDEAGEVLDAFAAASRNDKLIETARRERERIAKARFFFDKSFDIPPATVEAERCFDLGRKSFRRGKYGDALVYYQMGHALDVNFPGFLRELGATYEKVGAHQERLDFYTRYLLLRPIGKNADFVRKQLEASKAELGVLNVESSLPCDEFWLSGTRGARLPVQNLKVPPGKFKALCVNFQHELAYFEYATITAGKTSTLKFRWAIIENHLKNPLGRIRVQDPRSEGDMIDLGVSSTAVGVVVPDQDRAIPVELVSEDGTRSQRRYIRLVPGQRHRMAW
jgi:tetratricopeptide (TPR) repeat protein